MLQGAGSVEEAQQQRADKCALTFLVPAKSCDHAVAIALVLDLEHHAFVGLVGSRRKLGHDAVKTCALKAAKPVCGDAAVGGGRGQMDGRRRRCEQRFQLAAPGLEWLAAKILVSLAKQVEEHE